MSRHAADAAVIAGALAAGWLLAAVLREATPAAERPSSALWALDLAVGALACLALSARRRFPTPLALALAPLNVLSSVANVACLVAVFNVGASRRARTVVLVAGAQLLGVFGGIVLDGFVGDPVVSLLAVALVLAAVAGWGTLVRTRRTLVAERARTAERERIAAEMHDVLGHRISLLSLHAGALEVQATGTGLEAGAARIGDAAREAMTELRGVVGVLRTNEPLPAYADLPRLIERSREAGLPVEFVDEAETVPSAPGRDAYRIVQEALTNVHRHAGPVPTRVHVSRHDHTLAIEVRNRLGRDSGRGAGTGLVRLAERAQRLEHGRRGGEYVLRAELRL